MLQKYFYVPKEHYLFNNFDDIFYVAVLFWLSHTNSIKHAIFIHKFHNAKKAKEKLFFNYLIEFLHSEYEKREISN